MKRLLASVLAAAVLCLGAVTAPATAGGPQAFDTAANLVFTLVSPQQKDGSYGLCTGFILSEDTASDSTLVASAGHCALDGVNIALIDGGQYQVSWMRASTDPGYDSAVGIIYGYLPPARRLGSAGTSACFGVPVPGDTVVTIGYGWGQLQNESGQYEGMAGEVAPEAFPTDIWGVVQMDKPVKPGQSGSPVLNAQGCIVGIMVYTITDGMGGTTLYGGITRLDVALALWDYYP